MLYNTTSRQKNEGIGLQELLALLAQKTGYQPKSSRKGFTARCPAHNDKSPSLSITGSNDGKILLHCFAGCPVEEICNFLGIEIKNLFPKTGKRIYRG